MVSAVFIDFQLFYILTRIITIYIWHHHIWFLL